jgi:hypothetical protein
MKELDRIKERVVRVEGIERVRKEEKMVMDMK